MYNAHIKTTLAHDESMKRLWKYGSTNRFLDRMMAEIDSSFDGDEWTFAGMLLERLDACKFFLYYDSLEDESDMERARR